MRTTPHSRAIAQAMGSQHRTRSPQKMVHRTPDFGATPVVVALPLPLAGTTVILRDWNRGDLDRCRFWLLQEPRAWELDGYCAHPRPVSGRQSGEWRRWALDPSFPVDWPDPQDWRTLTYTFPSPTPENVILFLERKSREIAERMLMVPRASLVIADAETDDFLGTTSWSWHLPHTYTLTVQIIIYDPLAWGSGRGCEALGLWTDYLFKTMSIETVSWLTGAYLHTWAANHMMRRVAQKVGYNTQLWSRDRDNTDDEYIIDLIMYGVSVSDWNEMYPDGFAAHRRRT